MRNILLLVSLELFLSSCHSHKKCVEKIDPACKCTKIYDPVCGCNNKTYSNACVAKCSGIKTFTKGECPKTNNLTLEGQMWRLTTLAVSPAPQKVPEEVMITIQFESGKVFGSGGCNKIGGNYSIDKNKITLSNLLSTKMYCEPVMKWEDQFLKLLDKCKSYTIKGGLLELNCGEPGNLIFQQQ